MVLLKIPFGEQYQANHGRRLTIPTSDPQLLTPIASALWRIQPKSVLDLGAGFGKFGVLCREYLDVAEQRISPDDWRTTITAVEGFKGYDSLLMQYVYDEVLFEDFSKGDYRGYDLVLMIDSLEHLEKSVGLDVLTRLIMHNKNVLVSTPVTTLEQGAVNGNEYERHRAQWNAGDFLMLGGKELHSRVCQLFHFKGNQ